MARRSGRSSRRRSRPPPWGAVSAPAGVGCSSRTCVDMARRRYRRRSSRPDAVPPPARSGSRSGGQGPTFASQFALGRSSRTGATGQEGAGEGAGNVGPPCATSPTTSASCAPRLDEVRQYLRIDDLRDRRPQLETEASRPDLWDDADKARAVTGELASVTDDIEAYEALESGRRRRRDPRRDGPRGGRRVASSPRSTEAIAGLRRRVLGASSCAACSPASTTRTTPSASSRPARAAPTPRTGPTCCCACTCAGPSGAASTSSSTRCPRAPRPASRRPPSW